MFSNFDNEVEPGALSIYRNLYEQTSDIRIRFLMWLGLGKANLNLSSKRQHS